MKFNKVPFPEKDYFSLIAFYKSSDSDAYSTVGKVKNGRSMILLPSKF